MFTNTKICTVWEKTEKNRAPTYIRHETGAVYWEGADAQGGGKNRSPDDHALAVIPAANLGGYLPKPDDRIMRGIIADEQPPPTALTVMNVKDFRYGSPRVQHVEVIAQ